MTANVGQGNIDNANYDSGMAVLEWLVGLLNLSFDMGVVPMDCRGVCIVPLYKGKGDKCECSNLEVLVC